MSKFIIQSRNINGNLIPMHDFGIELINAIEYQKWFRGETEHEFVLVEKDSPEYAEFIPVGSVEFVSKHMILYKNVKKVKPINIPDELMGYTNRFVKRADRADIWSLYKTYKKLFIKDDELIKGFSNVCDTTTNLPESKYIVSELIDIQSEWRCFVRNGELLDIKCYSGRFDILPNIDIVKNMIKDFKSAPPAYTLDVAITDEGDTVIIECHNFFSCGLYGFADYRYLIDMLVKSYKWQLNQ